MGGSNQASSLSWVELPGAEGCGGAPAIAKAVEERLGRHLLVSPAQADLSIEGRVERSGRPPFWHATVRLRDKYGAVLGIRELQSASDDCGELRASVALAAALMIDPDALLHPPAPPPPLPSPVARQEPPAPVPPRIVIERVEVLIPVVASPTPSWGAEQAASFALGFGVLPSTAVGLRLGITVSPPRAWSIEAFGGVWSNQILFAEAGAQVRFSLPYVGLALCPLRVGRSAHARVTVCAGGEVGFLESASQGFVGARTELDPTLSVVTPARLVFPIVGGVAARIGGELGLALIRNQFVYEGPTPSTHVVSSPPLATAAVEAGLSVLFP